MILGNGSVQTYLDWAIFDPSEPKSLTLFVRKHNQPLARAQ